MADEQKPAFVAKYPEHEKLTMVHDKSQAIGVFIEWLSSQQMCLGQWVEFEGYEDAQFVTWAGRINGLLARFFSIDEDKLEAEKRDMLELMRSSTTVQPGGEG